MKQHLIKLKVKIIYLLITVCSKSKITAEFYYFFFSPKFRREHYSVLNGRLEYIKKEKDQEGNKYLLTRNIHRIEKGLLMMPRRDVFGKGYIKETIKSLELVLKSAKNFKDQILWAIDVLDEYFKVCASDDLIKLQQERYNNLKENFSLNKTGNKKPYKVVKNSEIDFHTFLKLVKQRKSVRWFDNKKVERDLIDKAILAAGYSPSACNRQPYEYRIIDDQSLLNKLVNLPTGTSGYSHNIPVMLIAIGDLSAYYSDRDRHLIYIDASLANMTLMYALETLGLSSCPINWPDIGERERAMSEILNLKSYQRPVMCMAIGYAKTDSMVAYSGKNNLETIRKYN